MIKINNNCYFGMVSKIHSIYKAVLNHHKFKIYKSDDGEWHLYLVLKTKYDEEHFLNNYKKLKDIKWEFAKNLPQLQVYMDNLEDGLLMRSETKKNFYNFKVAQ